MVWVFQKDQIRSLHADLDSPFGALSASTYISEEAGAMNELGQWERTFSFILKRLLDTGQAPFITEISDKLGGAVKDGHKALQGFFRRRKEILFSDGQQIPLAEERR